MTNDELRVKVAELCGWRVVSNFTGYPPPYNPRADLMNSQVATLPDYNTCRDACVEFEKDAPIEYWHQLADDLGCRQFGSDILQAFRLIGLATPAQRCRSFIKTMEDHDAKE